MNAQRLYTPEILAAAVMLVRFPMSGDLPFCGDARSASCGSSLRIGLATDARGCISNVGLEAHACAIGQAAAAIFAQGAIGHDRTAIAQTADGLAGWLKGNAAMPDWPGLEMIAPAREYPARHGAILLAWQAAVRALNRSEP